MLCNSNVFVFDWRNCKFEGLDKFFRGMEQFQMVRNILIVHRRVQEKKKI